MSFYASVQIALKGDLVEKFFKEFPREDKETYYNADIQEENGAVGISWMYDKWPFDEIHEWASKMSVQHKDDILYMQQNEEDEHITWGAYYENPFFNPEFMITFNNPATAFEEVWKSLKENIGEEKTSEALNNFLEKMNINQTTQVAPK